MLWLPLRTHKGNMDAHHDGPACAVQIGPRANPQAKNASRPGLWASAFTDDDDNDGDDDDDDDNDDDNDDE